MAMILVLVPAASDELNLEPAALDELGRLGVTNVALLRDSCVAGLVLEGWAFDPCSAPRAVRAVTGASDGARTLRPVMQMSVSSAAARSGRTHGEEGGL